MQFLHLHKKRDKDILQVLLLFLPTIVFFLTLAIWITIVGK